MRRTVSVAVFFYVASAIIDLVLGISVTDVLESYLFRAASAAVIVGAYLHLKTKRRSLKPLSFMLLSLVLSLIAVTFKGLDPTLCLNLAFKIIAAILTMKPELIEVEIIAEDKGATHEIMAL